MTVVTEERTARETTFRSSAELREVLERLLERVDSDQRIGPVLRAAKVRARFVFSDRRVYLNVASADRDDHSLEWSFAARAPWPPKVVLRMDSAVANGWLQGEQSLAIAIARGRVRCVGETRSTLFFVPVAKLLTEPYRELIASDYEHLQLG